LNRRDTIAFYKVAARRAVEEGLMHQVDRHLAQTDLFYLLVKVKGWRDVNRDRFYEWCRWVESRPHGPPPLGGLGWSG